MKYSMVKSKLQIQLSNATVKLTTKRVIGKCWISLAKIFYFVHTVNREDFRMKFKFKSFLLVLLVVPLAVVMAACGGQNGENNNGGNSPATMYTVTWKNWDGTVLKTDTNVANGTTPSYSGATPTKPSDASYNYTFNGWSPAITAVNGANQTYTAQFTATAIPVFADVGTYSLTKLVFGNGNEILMSTVSSKADITNFVKTIYPEINEDVLTGLGDKFNSISSIKQYKYVINGDKSGSLNLGYGDEGFSNYRLSINSPAGVYFEYYNNGWYFAPGTRYADGKFALMQSISYKSGSIVTESALAITPLGYSTTGNPTLVYHYVFEKSE